MILKLIIKYLIYIFFIINVYSIKVSVIIPVYNDEKYLNRILTAVINQTLKDIEIICIDDGSKDNSLEILKRFEEKESRMKVIHFDENKGQSVARNKGIDLAKGEFLSFIDGDDDVDSRYLEFLYNYSNNYDFVVSPFARGTNYSKAYYVDKTFDVTGFLFDSLIRKEFIDKYNIKFPEDKRIAEDVLFRRNCYQYNPRIFEAPDKGIYYYYKERSGSTWKKSKKVIAKIKRRAEKETRKRKYDKQTGIVMQNKNTNNRIKKETKNKRRIKRRLFKKNNK